MKRVDLLQRLFDALPARAGVARLTQWDEFAAEQYRVFCEEMADKGEAFLPFDAWLWESMDLAALAA